MLKNKVALVTGSSGGIGKYIALKLACEGYDVVIHYNQNEENGKKVELECKNYGVKTLLVQADLSNEDDIKNMIDKIINEFGKIDILVNNAAIEINSDFKEKTKETFKKVLDVNLIGTFLVTKYASKYMLENKYGKIVNITSNNAINKYDPSTLEYDASKAGIISLTHNFALEFAPYINVNAVAPGWVLTEKVKELNNSLDGMLEQEENKKILIKRFTLPEEVANLVLFLVSDEARAINNEIIKIDGGTY